MHAYLIMAHNGFDTLKKLICLLDDVRNDIYIHIDARADGFIESDFDGAAEYSKLHFIKRSTVFWADFSQTSAELDLLEAACEGGEYSYYHLLSGSDLPLKTQDEIHTFFEGRNDEFIGICPKEVPYSVNRLKYYHFLTGNRFYRKSKPLKGLDLILTKLQALFGINRLKGENIKVIDGWTWFSVTDDFARYIVSKRSYIEKIFSKSIASDELVMQTMIYNNPEFYSRIYDTKSLTKGSLRCIDWKRGRPYTFKNEDFEELINAEDVLFARKFDAEVDSLIIDRLFENIRDRQKK